MRHAVVERRQHGQPRCGVGERGEVLPLPGGRRVLVPESRRATRALLIDRATGETFQGEVPAYSVVVPGSLPGRPTKSGGPGPNLYCAVIVKRVDESTRAKTSINELLRD